MDTEKLEKVCTQPSNKYYDMFQNPRQAYLCLSDKDFLGMAAIKYTVDP
jgi:hypothetical protein